jgi:hypothetical protein
VSLEVYSDESSRKLEMIGMTWKIRPAKDQVAGRQGALFIAFRLLCKERSDLYPRSLEWGGIGLRRRVECVYSVEISWKALGLSTRVPLARWYRRAKR